MEVDNTKQKLKKAHESIDKANQIISNQQKVIKAAAEYIQVGDSMHLYKLRLAIGAYDQFVKLISAQAKTPKQVENTNQLPSPDKEEQNHP